MKRNTGIDAMGEAPWGTHFCQFYANKEDLTEILVPYFKAGLENDESCLWVTSEPLGVEEAWEVLARAVPDLDAYRRLGRIEIVPHSEWYLSGNCLDWDRALRRWRKKLDAALAGGCAGLRLTGNTFWLENAHWRSFTQYEAAIDALLGRYKILALCTYSLERCSAPQLADVLKNHELALFKRDGVWEQFERSGRRRLKASYNRALGGEHGRLPGMCTGERRPVVIDGSEHTTTSGRLAQDAQRDEDRRKNEFLAVLSHELRNPLAPIKNSLYILERAVPGGEQARRAQAVIERQVRQLARLVDDLLDVTRITRNQIRLQRERLDLNEIVWRALEDQRSLFEKNGVALDFAPAAGKPFVNADGNRLAQVLGNLLHNAGKFTSPGGDVRVSVDAESYPGQAAIHVTDSGIGIAPDVLSRLFEPFVQANTTIDRGQGGLGLGLALVKGIVALHGGHVSAHSEGLGKGADFVVRLPLERTDAVEAKGAGDGAAAVPRRVLIIEDNVDAADTLREALELTGHQVEVAYDGAEGLARGREFRPDVVLCDIGLPVLDGYEVAQRFRGDEALQATVLVALSGYALPEDVQRAAEAGFARHLSKPPSLEQIEALLRALPDTRPASAS